MSYKAARKAVVLPAVACPVSHDYNPSIPLWRTAWRHESVYLICARLLTCQSANYVHACTANWLPGREQTKSFADDQDSIFATSMDLPPSSLKSAAPDQETTENNVPRSPESFVTFCEDWLLKRFLAEYGLFLNVPLEHIVLDEGRVNLMETFLNAGSAVEINYVRVRDRNIGSTIAVNQIYRSLEYVVQRRRADARYNRCLENHLKYLFDALFVRRIGELCEALKADVNIGDQL
uniref:NR LBD domain-containing protein n=1 Tax=Steinernema glaseri TaxID=37863 RepID=A0A1I8ARE2_9BILA